MFNGSFVHFLGWVIGGLASLISVLVGFIVKLHMNSDEEYRAASEKVYDEYKKRTDEEILRLRQRMHELTEQISTVLALIELRKTERNRREQ